MPKLELGQCRSLVYRYFLTEGWLPPGTTDQSWSAVTMGAMGIDDPPVPHDPNLQKKRIALDLQAWFFALGSSLEDPLGQLASAGLTLGEFADWCAANQQ